MINGKLQRPQADIINAQIKGVPIGLGKISIGDVPGQRWNLLRGDLPLPAALLRESALRQNSEWMRKFLAFSGALLCPHGKTTMSPQLFQRQLDDGAWGITISTVQQLYVARCYGLHRIFMANQLVGTQEIRYVLAEIKNDPHFDFYCLVDSLDGVKRLAAAAHDYSPGRPLQVLVEGGYFGGRTGCRTLEQALQVASAVKQSEPDLALRGVEGFEGLIQFAEGGDNTKKVCLFVEFLVSVALACEEHNLFAPGVILLSAGGSAYYDLVGAILGAAPLRSRHQVILRSGCYLTHDSRLYSRLNGALRERMPGCDQLGPGLVPALEVWTYVQSVPEANLVILTAGRRECGHDAGLPVPLKWFRPHQENPPIVLDSSYEITGLNDQHSYLRVPTVHPLRVGDMIALGISHPCTTFDKWKVLFLVDDEYNITSAIQTYF